jgi:tRNA pseudouridine38-40 synthase
LRAKDAQAQRYIIDFKVQAINEDFLVFDITGQSFIYHQIRKMIGSIMMVIANNYPPSFINNTFFRNQIHMPLAPAEGLFLV